MGHQNWRRQSSCICSHFVYKDNVSLMQNFSGKRGLLLSFMALFYHHFLVSLWRSSNWQKRCSFGYHCPWRQPKDKLPAVETIDYRTSSQRLCILISASWLSFLTKLIPWSKTTLLITCQISTHRVDAFQHWRWAGGQETYSHLLVCHHIAMPKSLQKWNQTQWDYFQALQYWKSSKTWISSLAWFHES